MTRAEGSRKSQVRARVRAARAAISPAAREAAAEAVAARLITLPELETAHAVLAYAPMPEEIDVAAAVEALLRHGVRVAYPRVCGPTELALHWADPDELEPGYCHIPEPAAGSPLADPAEIDVVLVPGVAFDGECRRLGMGAGFYDALLAGALARATRVAAAYDEQVVAEIPCEAHDVAVDVLVTPTRVVRAQR